MWFTVYHVSKICNHMIFHTCRFQEVIELLPQQVFRISCTIKSQMLSQDTEYVCYLVFKLSETCQGTMSGLIVYGLEFRPL
ncbi:putative phloem protein [Helianthus anomalus]